MDRRAQSMEAAPPTMWMFDYKYSPAAQSVKEIAGEA